MRILLDCDGVLADFVGPFLDLVNEEFSTSTRREDVTRYDIAKALGWDDAFSASVSELVCRTLGMVERLPVIDGAREAVRALTGWGEIYVVTSPWPGHPTWAYERARWLWRHFGFASKHIVSTSAKHIIDGDVLVDDKTETLRAWRDAHPNGTAFQFRTLHNANDEWDGMWSDSWRDLADCIRHIAQESNLCR